MLVNMDEAEWDAVIAVHLKGHFAPTRHAAAYWRDQAKSGAEVRARVINTASPSGVFGNVGQSNYGAAKAGIAAFTVIVAQELGRYGVTVKLHRAERPNPDDGVGLRAAGGQGRVRRELSRVKWCTWSPLVDPSVYAACNSFVIEVLSLSRPRRSSP
jgi:NAD(P)-dependent dehydrogenase (short-subunit alcohol dehydrogenase family)